MGQKLWLFYAYNLNTGDKGIISTCMSPVNPNQPFYFGEKFVKTKWILADALKGKDLRIIGSGYKIDISKIQDEE